MIANSDILTRKFPFSHRAVQPPLGGRRPSPQKIRLLRRDVAQREMTEPYFPLR
jgi:hypothetical protein